ncbi:restriction endonuclease subunit S [Streptomyces mirabilis]|uniref:restriction endonuclease subunit S n=1 Tax=Streptomyces mirabilis TaxID=68239 RepID=UPI0036932D8B
MSRLARPLHSQIPLRRFIREITDGPFGSSLTSSHYSDDGARVVRLGNIGPARFKDGDAAFIPMDYFNGLRRHEVKPGDLLIAGLGDENHSVGRACVAPNDLGPSIVKADCFRVRLDQSRLLHRYAAWALSSSVVSGQVLTLTRGSTRARINLEVARDIQLPVPPLEEQRRIADFLDAETARIDRLADARRRHLNLVEERWESTIHSELTASGAEMVELRRLGVAVTTGPFGTVFNASEYEEGGIPMVNPLHIKNGQITPDRHHSVSQTTASRLSRHLLRSGDLVVGRKGDLGRAALVADHQDGWVCGSDCIAVHPSSRLRANFLAYVLRSQYVRTQLLARSLAATMPSLSEGNLLSLRIPNFDLQRQDEATASLDAAHDWFVRAVTAMRSQLALLTERRQALITAAVTGQFDVSTASERNVTDGVSA